MRHLQIKDTPEMPELTSPAPWQFDLPLPPLELRRMVGPVEPKYFDNPTGQPIIENIPIDKYESVLDFGCGCGRIARQLLQQKIRPKCPSGDFASHLSRLRVVEKTA